MRNSISKAAVLPAPICRALLLFVLVCGCTAAPVSRNLGARCDGHGDCAEMCLPASDYPGGFCTTLCDQDSDCPGAGVCVAENQGVCLMPCTAPDDCSELGQGWTCAELPHRPDGLVKACVGQ